MKQAEDLGGTFLRPQRDSKTPTKVRPGGADRRVNDSDRTTEDDANQPEVSDVSLPGGEAELVSALARAAEAGRFDVVPLLAKELEARRLERAGNVVPFGKPSNR